MREVVIASAVRTPVGKFGGTLKDIPAPDLGALVLKEAVNRAGIEPNELNEVIMGNVIQAGLGQNPARQAMIFAGLPVEIPAFTVNKVCGSGLKSVVLAAQAIKAGDADIILAGGQENMNQAPYLLRKARYGYRLFNQELVDSMVFDGLWDKYNDFHMGNTGEIIAEKCDVTREDADRFALRSNKLAAKAQEDGLFKEEILPMEVKVKRDMITFAHDEGVRGSTTFEKLQSLKPVFKKDGVVTAGNASQISDGASATVIMGADIAEKKGITPLAKITHYHSEGVIPELVMYAPIPTTKTILMRAGLTPDDIDVFEHNEAFATASVAVQNEFDISDDRFNVHGGAVAIGHPIGASGNRVLTTLLYAMKNRKAHRGLCTLCLGGGIAVTMIVEMDH
jgi:acetyl-CoA C-acetyltransferase